MVAFQGADGCKKTKTKSKVDLMHEVVTCIAERVFTASSVENEKLLKLSDFLIQIIRFQQKELGLKNTLEYCCNYFFYY